MYATIVKGVLHKLATFKGHMKTCTQGKTIVDCPNEKVKAPLTNYERTFYDEGYASQPAISWLEKTSASLGTHIHHAMCGHGGERYILGAPVDGYAPDTGSNLSIPRVPVAQLQAMFSRQGHKNPRQNKRRIIHRDSAKNTKTKRSRIPCY